MSDFRCGYLGCSVLGWACGCDEGAEICRLSLGFAGRVRPSWSGPSADGASSDDQQPYNPIAVDYRSEYRFSFL